MVLIIADGNYSCSPNNLPRLSR